MKIVKLDSNGVFTFTYEDQGKEFFQVDPDNIIVVEFPEPGMYEIEDEIEN